MKTITTFYLLFFSMFTLTAQVIETPLESFYNPDQPSHVYYKDVNNILDKFIGTWEYNYGDHYFKITFIKQIHIRETPVANTKTTIFTDRIVGNYQYKLNGIEIYNVDSNNFALSTSGAISFNGFKIYFNEPSSNPCGRRIMGYVNLIYSNTSGIETIGWNRTNIDWGRNCNPSDQTPFRIPANMVLIKL